MSNFNSSLNKCDCSDSTNLYRLLAAKTVESMANGLSNQKNADYILSLKKFTNQNDITSA